VKCWILYCLLGYAALTANAQLQNVQHILLTSSGNLSAENLASHFRMRYATKEEQLRAAYAWVTTNIRYSTDSAYYFDQAVTHEEKIEAVLRRRKGVCEHYASLFVEIAQKMDIPAFVVHGLVKVSSSAAHSWAAVQLDNKWYLCDPTWDAVQRPDFLYYRADPWFFAQTHLPFDPIWQLVETPVGYKQNGKKPPFNFNDSIRTYMSQDSLQRYIAIERRMKDMNVNRSLYKTWQNYNRMKIVIIAGEEDMRLYNLAVEELNKAKSIFNEFVLFRNNQFLPSKDDASLAEMLKPVKELITKARQHISMIGKITDNHQYNTASLQNQLNSLEKRTDEQIGFLKLYLATISNEREKLFLEKRPAH